MKTRDFVLLALNELGGRISGKTKLQKQVYLVEALAKVSSALGYRAHYYGPYSPDVEAATDELWSLGLLEKSVEHTGQAGARGFEIVRYDFKLTPAGRRAAEQLARKCSEEAGSIAAAARRVSSAGNLHYTQLATAAKCHYILRRSETPLTEEEISDTAATLDWKLPEDDIAKAADFLVTLDLAKRCE